MMVKRCHRNNNTKKAEFTTLIPNEMDFKTTPQNCYK